MHLDRWLFDALFRIGFVAIPIAFGGYTMGSATRKLMARKFAGVVSLLQGLFIALLLPLLNEDWRPPLASPLQTVAWVAVFVLAYAVAVAIEPWLYGALGYRTTINLGCGALLLLGGVAFALVPANRASDQLCGVMFLSLIGAWLVYSAAKPLLQGKSLDDSETSRSDASMPDKPKSLSHPQRAKKP